METAQAQPRRVQMQNTAKRTVANALQSCVTRMGGRCLYKCLPGCAQQEVMHHNTPSAAHQRHICHTEAVHTQHRAPQVRPGTPRPVQSMPPGGRARVRGGRARVRMPEGWTWYTDQGAMRNGNRTDMTRDSPKVNGGTQRSSRSNASTPDCRSFCNVGRMCHCVQLQRLLKSSHAPHL